MCLSEGISELYILCLDDFLLVYVNYIMGYDWCFRLQKGFLSGNLQFDGGEVIFKVLLLLVMFMSELVEVVCCVIM